MTTHAHLLPVLQEGALETGIERLLLEGGRLEEAGDFTGAAETFTRAIERDPLNAVAHHRRGWARAHLGDLKGEIADWSKAIELDPVFAEAYADRAAARVASGDTEGAVADWQQALNLNPDREQVLQPLLRRLKEKLERAAQGGAATELMGPEQELSLGVQRRAFLKTVGAVAVTTIALSTATGCATRGAANAKVRWGMIIDLKRCIGCKACTVACKAENHTPPGVAYNVVMEEEVGEYPYVTRRFLPRPCMQCANSSCTQVCPTGATYHRPDGIVAVDYDKCIGCRYCIAACPYGARSFDYGETYEKDLNPHERQPSPEYGEYRRRDPKKSPSGNVRKCTFCLHRLANGLNPACAETCIGRAIHFGNLADPEAKCTLHGETLRELLATRSHMRLKEELGNDPAVHYLT